MRLPDTDDSLVIRTDFSDDAAWDALCAEMRAPVDDFQANLAFVSDPALDGVRVVQLLGLLPKGLAKSFLFVVDSTALHDPEHPVLVVDLFEERGRTFRAIPSESWSVENNLALANMDFHEFAESADANGVYRGFS